MTPLQTLETIQKRLTNTPAVQIIEELLPRTRLDALSWAKRLPSWGEHPFPGQVIGIARTISRRAMHEHGLAFNTEGQIIEQESRPTPRRKSFLLDIARATLAVIYTRDYFPGQDGFYFTKDEPSQTHCLSKTGYWHQFTPHEAVEACGGAQPLARRLRKYRAPSPATRGFAVRVNRT